MNDYVLAEELKDFEKENQSLKDKLSNPIGLMTKEYLETLSNDKLYALSKLCMKVVAEKNARKENN